MLNLINLRKKSENRHKKFCFEFGYDSLKIEFKGKIRVIESQEVELILKNGFI